MSHGYSQYKDNITATYLNNHQLNNTLRNTWLRHATALGLQYPKTDIELTF